MSSIKIKLQNAVRCTLTLISPKLNTTVSYRIKFGKKLNLDDPKTLNGKISWLKLYNYPNNDLVRQCADKYRVRKYIEQIGCKEILVPLIASYDNPQEIEWEKLPNRFVIKWNYGAGLNYVCKDKSTLNTSILVNQLSAMGKKNMYLPYAEVQYKKPEKKLIIEEFLDDKQYELPLDYKVYCFNGKADCVMLCVGRDEFGPENMKLYYFDRDWNFLRINKDGMKAPEGFTLPKPDGIDDLFKYADKLSTPFPFVRADFYLVNGKVYFGELTFTPCGGMDGGMPESLDLYLGGKMDLSKLMKKESN